MRLFLLATLLCTALTTSAQRQLHHRATIYYQQAEQLQLLDELGVAIDHGKHRVGYSLESDFSDAELQIISEQGLRYEINIRDVRQYYIDQNNPNSSRYIGPEAALKNESCSSGNDLEFAVPSNYHNGTMGGFLDYDELLIELDEMYAYCQANNLDIMTARADNTNPADPQDFKTEEGRYQQWVKISDAPATSNEGEPQVLYTALHHAREPASMQQLVFYMWYLIENYATDPEIQDIVDNTELYFIPCVNPDGYVYNKTIGPNGGGFWRKNRRGGYGVDPNRNYSYITPGGEEVWGGAGTSSNQSGETFPGTGPFSEPENRGIRHFVETHEFTMALNNHTSGGLLLYPFGYARNRFTTDHELFGKLSEEMVADNNYSNIISAGLYPAAGDSDDFMYGMLTTSAGGTREKVFAMTPEIGPSFWPAESQIIGICQDMVHHNLRAAQFSGPFGIIRDETGSLAASTSYAFEYNFTRLGFAEGTYTVSINPLTANILAVGDDNIYGSINQGETISDDILLELNPGIETGEVIAFELSLDNGRFIQRLQISKVFGEPTVLYTEDATNLDQWITSDWGLSSSEFHPDSPPTSITDSPNGNYPDQAQNAITLIDEVDLTATTLTAANVTFYTKWDIEADYDYVQFLVSIDNGNSWIPQCGQYTNTGVDDQTGAEGEPLYDSGQSEWVLEEVNLSDYLGETILLRFELHSDGNVNGDGFYFDRLQVNVVESLPSSTQSAFLADQMKVYPNPVQNQLQIATTLTHYNYQLANMLGQPLLNAQNVHGQEQLDLSALVPGIYLLTIEKDGEQLTKRVMKD